MNRTSVVALVAIAALLVACPKKNAGDADAAADAAPTPVATDTVAVVDSGPATPLTTAATAKTVAKPTDAGMADAGKAMMSDAAAPIADLCCCKVGGKLSHATQSECTTTLKGTCTKKEECEAKSCCCDMAGTKANKLQTECSAGKGTCVKKDQCK